jgi:predicted HTH transcriptional regulator
MYKHHAIPLGWERIPYQEFLKQRRLLIAQTIRAAYEHLAGHTGALAPVPPIAEIVAQGETDAVEFKSTLRTNLHTGEKDARMEMMVLRTIAGFLNTSGGTLIVGVSDDGAPVGLEADGFPNEDKASLHLINLLKDRLGGQHAINVHPRFDDFEGARVLVVKCDKAKAPVFVADGQRERFFVRYGPSTQELLGAAAQAFIQQRFH